jgi:hypothetical protein
VIFLNLFFQNKKGVVRRKKTKERMDTKQTKNITSFKSLVGNIVKNGEGLEDSRWKLCSELVTQVVCDDAFQQIPRCMEMFRKLGENIESRPCKLFERVQEKKIQNNNQLFQVQPFQVQPFQVVSDLMGFRVLCPLSEFASKIAIIKDIVQTNPENRLFDNHFNPKEFFDIKHVVHVYIKEFGYIIEIQICHPFAALTMDLLRKDENIVDLRDSGLYDMVKDYLIHEDQITTDEDRQSAVSLIKATADQLFTGHPLPEKLTSILRHL